MTVIMVNNKCCYLYGSIIGLIKIIDLKIEQHAEDCVNIKQQTITTVLTD